MKTRLQELRKDAGFKSARAFAEHIGMSVGTYTDYEQGRRKFTFEAAWKFADELGVSLDELAGRQWPRPPTALASDESHLLTLYRDTDQRGRAAILRTAEGEAGMEEKPASGDGAGAVSA